MNKKTAFILMPFADEFSDVYEYLISNGLQDAGYAVKRADDIKSQSNIIGDIIEGIINSDLVVADLTGANPNVYLSVKTTDNVSGGAWGRRPHTFGASTLLISQWVLL